MDDRLALYFGCLREPGHYMWVPGKAVGWVGVPPSVGHFPWSMEYVDDRLLKNRGLPDRCDGRVAWFCGGRPDVWHGFLWWDRSVDSRSGSHSGLYVRGFRPLRQDARPAFEYARGIWSAVDSRQLVPLVLDLDDPAVNPPATDHKDGEGR